LQYQAFTAVVCLQNVRAEILSMHML
jgi:hypothetical protein